MKIIIGMLIVVALVVGGYFGYTNLKDQSFGATTQYGNAYDLVYENLIGTGLTASSTSLMNQTFFEFASSTDKTYWDTETRDYPQYYGATPTAQFLTRNADAITLNIAFDPKDATSKLDYLLQYSNEDSCGNASSTLATAYWYKLPTEKSTTTPWINTADNTYEITGLSDTLYTGLTISDINYKCLKVQFYNSSTTDNSLLKVDATFKIKNNN